MRLFGYYGSHKDEQVKDPYYGGQSGFERNYKQVVAFSKRFLVEEFAADPAIEEESPMRSPAGSGSVSPA